MTALDDLWDFDDPAASEARFRAAVEAAEADGDPAAADEARTQLARSLGLQGRFVEGHAVLDAGRPDHPADDRVRVRSRLERGRLLRSSGDPAPRSRRSRRPGSSPVPLGEDGLAVDAAHMLALVDAPPGEAAWHTRALDLADASPDPDARRWRGSLWNNIGWARFEAGDLDGALAAFETALAARREQGKRQGDAHRRVVRRPLPPCPRPARRGAGHPRAPGRRDGGGGRPRGRLRGGGDRRVPARPGSGGRGTAALRPCRGPARGRRLAGRARARPDRPAQAARSGQELVSVLRRGRRRGSVGRSPPARGRRRAPCACAAASTG